MTDADKNIDDAKRHIRSAIKSLSAVVIAECEGTEDFKDLYFSTLQGSLNKLINIRKELD